MNTLQKAQEIESAIQDCLFEEVATQESKQEKEKMARKSRTKKQRENSDLKKHMKYLIPRIKLTLIRESGLKTSVKAICSPKDASYFLEPLRTYPEEHFVSLHLNAKNEVVGYQEISHGTLSASLVHPREVFKAALINNTFSLLVAHNHPSGAKLSPSKEDLDTTRQLLKAGKILGVSLMDHVIIGECEIYSIRENHPRIWDDPFGQ